MNLISVSIKRPTSVAMFALAVFFTGLVSLSRLPLELTPDVDFPRDARCYHPMGSMDTGIKVYSVFLQLLPDENIVALLEDEIKDGKN